MESEPPKRPVTAAGEFHRAGAHESTRVARALARQEPVPAETLALVQDADEVGAQLHVSGPTRLPPELAELEQVHEAEAVGAELEPVEIPLPAGRSLIPTDVLEAIAREETELLDEEAFLEQEAAADEYDEEAHHLGDDDLDIVCEELPRQRAMELLRTAELVRDFPAQAMELLAEDAVRVHLEAGQPCFREGSVADSFFLVERGACERLRFTERGEAQLGTVKAGELFGLFGLLTRKLRTDTVRALGPAQVVELRAARLDAVARRFPAARQALARYFKDRLLDSFVTAGALFPELDEVGRAALISHFQDRKVAAGEVLLAPGEVQNHLALVTSGRIALSRRGGAGRDLELAHLARGEFFGVVSALAGLPTRVSIVATEPSTLCVLPQRAFNEFVKGYPSLRSLPARLASAGEQVERDVFVGEAIVAA